MSGSLSLSPGSARSTLGSVVLPSSSADILLWRDGNPEFSARSSGCTKAGRPMEHQGSQPWGCGAGQEPSVTGACVHRASLPRWEPTRGSPARQTILGAVSMPPAWKLRDGDGGFAFSPLPCTCEHPYPGTSSGWKYRLGELDRGCTVRMELCRGCAGCWHSTGSLLEPQTDAETSGGADASPALSIRPWAVRASCWTHSNDQYSFFSPAFTSLMGATSPELPGGDGHGWAAVGPTPPLHP